MPSLTTFFQALAPYMDQFLFSFLGNGFVKLFQVYQLSMRYFFYNLILFHSIDLQDQMMLLLTYNSVFFDII